jgi:hypothetical protein
MIQLDGHSMEGYGYDAASSLVYVYDTWGPNGQNPGTMTWGGTYSGMQQWGVDILTLAVPEPSTIVLLAIGAVGLFAWARRRRKS